MIDKDIIIKDNENNYRFNYRVAGVFLNNDKIFLQKSEEDAYYSLVGGRVKYNETTKEALIREVKEELGLTLNETQLELINVVENFFTYQETNIHELLFIYKIFDETLNSKDEVKVLDKTTVTDKWYNLKDLVNMDLRPSIIKETLNKKGIIHNIIK